MKKYFNTSSSSNLCYLLFAWLASPPAKYLASLRIKPNNITTFGNLLFLLGLTLYLLHYDLSSFALLFFAYYLDFCDGSVARRTNTVQTSSFRYDHWSDVTRFFLIFLSVGLRFSDATIWLFSFIGSSSFLYYNSLNHTLSDVLNSRQHTYPASTEEIAPKPNRGFVSLAFHYFSQTALFVNSLWLFLLLVLIYFPSLFMFATALFFTLCSYRSLQIILILSSIPRSIPNK